LLLQHGLKCPDVVSSHHVCRLLGLRAKQGDEHHVVLRQSPFLKFFRMAPPQNLSPTS
jgi:hypothetical protein